MMRLRTLGALDLRDSEGNECRSVLAQPKRVALLVYLALARPIGTHRRDTLLALFWPEQDTERGRNALSQAVHFLRRSLSETVITGDNETLALNASELSCDVIDFQEALDAGRTAEALELYRGDLLEGFHIANAPEFVRWLDAERDHLARLHTQAAERVANEREALGDFSGALTYWRRLAVRDPYNSNIALRVSRAMAFAGDSAGAIKHASMHETLLRDELEMAPPAELRAFIRELQNAPPSGPTLPAPTAPAASALASSTTPAGPHTREATATVVSRRRTTALVMTIAGLALLLAAATTVRARSRAPKARTIRSIAVLPFQDHSRDSSRSLADGLHDAVIAELARYPELRVTSRTSVIRYKGTTKDLPAIARELNVDGIVEGTVQHERGRVRVISQLIHGPTDTHLWSERFTRNLGDVLTLQEDLAAAIGKQVHVITVPSRHNAPFGERTAARELYLRELYLRGRHAELSRSRVGVQTAKDAYERAVREDSTFALGYAALSGLHTTIARYGYSATGPARDSARIFADRAIALDSTLSEARTARALVFADALAYDSAEREFKAAIELSPSDAQARFWYAMLLVVLGRGSEAMHEAKRALELDPFPPRGLIITLRSAEYVATGQRSFMKEPAGTRWTEFLKAEPGEPWAYRANAFDLAEVGKCSEARGQIARTIELAPNETATLIAVAMVEWWCGDRSVAHTLLNRAKQNAKTNAQAVQFANAHGSWGEVDSAFVWLNRVDWRLSGLLDLRATRWLDSVRGDPRYPQLLQRLGLPTTQN